MTLTHDFDDYLRNQLATDPSFARAYRRESIDVLLAGELDVGRAGLRNYVKAPIGFAPLGAAIGIPPKSLIRMLGRGGNPQARNLLAVIACLQRQSGVELHVTDVPIRTAELEVA